MHPVHTSLSRHGKPEGTSARGPTKLDRSLPWTARRGGGQRSRRRSYPAPPPELLLEQLKRATGRQLRGGKVVDLNPQEYQTVVRRCMDMESAHKPACRVR